MEPEIVHSSTTSRRSRSGSCCSSSSKSILLLHNNININRQEIERLLRLYPILLEPPPQQYAYGTAGFRCLAHVLPPVMVRVGIVAAMMACRSTTTSSSSTPLTPLTTLSSVGVMITASHNTSEYNGVKLADSSGGMLSPHDEALAVQFVNGTTEQVLQWIFQEQEQEQIIQIQQEQEQVNKEVPKVHVGRDTRDSSPALAEILMETLVHMGVTVVNHGVVTTPMLHHCVLHDNYHLNCARNVIAPHMIPHSPNVRGYYGLLSHAYQTLVRTVTTQAGETPTTKTTTPTTTTKRVLVVDCACGVGHVHLTNLTPLLQDSSSRLVVCATNAVGSGPLNEGCGSEHVQKSQSPPTWYDYDDWAADSESSSSPSSSSLPPLERFSYCASFDGDADRIVFFTNNTTNNTNTHFALLDGDKIACLWCHFLHAQLQALQRYYDYDCDYYEEEDHNRLHPPPPPIHHTTTKVPKRTLPTLGVVQTAYANGASTRYLKRILKRMDHDGYSDASSSSSSSSSSCCCCGGGVKTAKTGVKHLHHVAQTSSFDMAVYFESNGHGTILFKPYFHSFMQQTRKHFLLLDENIEEEQEQEQEQEEDEETTVTTVTTAAFAQAQAQARLAWKRLFVLPSLVNQAVGDAMSDLLLVDAVLQIQHWSLADWRSLYTDLPSRQLTVHVPDRTVMTTHEKDETVCVTPVGVQQDIDAAIQRIIQEQRRRRDCDLNEHEHDDEGEEEDCCRCFVRPSGTEDVVRVYAEASTQEWADALAREAADIVQRYCGSSVE